MTLQARNDNPKCSGQSDAGSHVCADRVRCGRYLRPEGDRQVWSDFWKAGAGCLNYESVPAAYHLTEDEPSKTEW